MSKLTKKQLFYLSDSTINVGEIIKFLNKISEIEVLREIFCEKILSPLHSLLDNQPIAYDLNEVSNLIPCEASNGRMIVRSSVATESNTIEMTVSSTSIGNPYKLNDSPTLPRSTSKEPTKQTYLQYFMEVLVKTEFPTDLATLLLQMLPNLEYKVSF